MKNIVALAYPFRLFFLLAGLYGSILALLWMAMLFWGWSAPALLNPMRWHAHEMLFGLTGAAIAGFLLTAICAWTGCQPIRNGALLLLGLVWVAGRVLVWCPIPPYIWMALDFLFFLVLTVYVAWIVLSTGNRRNLIVAAAMGVLCLANLLTHLDTAGVMPGGAYFGEQTALYLILLLMIIVAGRITPTFTANWLERNGGQRAWVKQQPKIDIAAIASTALLIPALWAGDPRIAAVVALIAAACNGVRLAGWGTRHCLREPLLWILHLGYAWIVVALLLRGLSPWVATITSPLWIHALGVGAMGTLIIGVMTRVALGHTARAMVLPRGAVSTYVLITIAAVTRLLSAMELGSYQGLLIVAAAAFSLSFLIFTLLYWSILNSPRVDGRPG